MKNINPTTTQSWQVLQQHYNNTMQSKQMKQMFANDADRCSKYSIQFQDIFFDYSKNIIDEKTMQLLLQLANECDVAAAIEAQFNGKKINVTENRAVLHTALRNKSNNPVLFEEKDVMPDIKNVLQQMEIFCNNIHNKNHLGYTGKPITTIVNIGIGGSDLGAVMVTEALKPYWIKGIQTYFVSNVDGTHIAETLQKINAEETLFLIASKTFTTQETMTNAYTARSWFVDIAKDETHIAKHFVALSTNEKEVIKFGIDQENIFQFWDWVGGRYSLWSAIGLSIALTIGYNNFDELLDGAYNADVHFKTEKFEKNIPVIMALLGVWYVNFFNAQSEAILPYDQYLHRFAAYFQQGNMESNGKTIDRNGEQVTYSTGPVIWGEPGTNGQHAFYQLIHQGTPIIPCDFIAPAISHNKIGDHHQKLLSHFFAQTEALLNGKTKEQVIEEFTNDGKAFNEIEHLISYKIFAGNKPTNSFIANQITPYTLGSLIAFYEHKIFVQGVIWNIYSYDQWGVELGKQLANSILPDLKNDEPITTHNSSTNTLINKYKQMRNAYYD
jgi:glucose-6-phosphate isomerase